jgi:hypothetical protein
MIKVFEMAHLVCDHIVQNLERGEDQLPLEREISFLRATSPSTARLLDAKSPVRSLDTV